LLCRDINLQPTSPILLFSRFSDTYTVKAVPNLPMKLAKVEKLLLRLAYCMLYLLKFTKP
jgi:hypothetical protein